MATKVGTEQWRLLSLLRKKQVSIVTIHGLFSASTYKSGLRKGYVKEGNGVFTLTADGADAFINAKG